MRNSFKKALSLVLALTLLMSMVCISNFAVSAETTQYQLGDANTDKRIDVMDSTTIQQIVASAVTATEEQRYLADVTGDGEVDIRDATLIQQYIAMLVIDVPTNKDGYKIGDFVTFGQNPTTPSTGSSEDSQPTSESATETQPTSESVEETSESTEATTESVATKTYTFYFAPLASDVEAGYNFVANILSDVAEDSWFPYEMKATGTTFNGAAVYAAEITVSETQRMQTLQFQVYDDTNWKHQILLVDNTVTPYSAYDGKIVVATAKDKGEVKDYVADEETQATSESETEPQPTSESSEETQPSSDEQTTTYGLHMSDGNGANWKTNPMTVNGDVATVEMQLTAGTYEFKITDGTNWYGNNGTIADTTTTTSQHGWDMSANDGNCKLTATGGTYTFAYTISTSKLIVTFVPAETQPTTESVEETSESVEETSESVEETSESTEATTESVATKIYTFYFAPLASDVEAGYKFIANVQSDAAVENPWFPYEMTATGTTFNGAAVYAAEITVPETQSMLTLQFQVYDDTNWKHQILVVDNTVTPYSAYDGKIVVATANDKGEVKDYVADEETQATSESETQPTSESSEETQASSSEEQTVTYGLHMNDGNGSNWKTNAMTTEGDVATVEMQLTAGTYEFKITDGTNWYGNNGTIADTTTTTSQNGWDMSANDGNCKLNATGGTYTFAYTISTSKLIVTFVPAETQATSESVEETSESSEETQPTSESSEETQPSSSEEQTVTYGLHMSDGNGSNWKTNAMTTEGDVATVEMQLTAGTYEFKITDGKNWYGNNGTIEDTTTTTSENGWDMSANDGNCKLNATGGTYTFAYTISTSKLIITFVPAETQATNPSEETPSDPTPTEPDPEPVASAYKVAGDFNDWGNSTDVMYYTSDEVVAVTITLDAGTYKFKITDGKTWYGNNGTIEDTTTITSDDGWDMSANDNDCTLKATGGTYTFTFNLTTKKLILVKEA